MSGGVDSSVAALLMKKKGYECIGATMRLIDLKADSNENLEGACGSGKEAEDAAIIAGELGMPFYLFDFTKEFKKCVIGNFIEEYSKGHTPNPCIECNRNLKFGALIKKAIELGCSKIATGHYAKVEYDEKLGRYLLKKAGDPRKDQTYVLYNLTQEELSYIEFPLSDYEKTEIRQIAEENNFKNANKQDSQDICFVPDGDYAAVIKRYTDREFPEGAFIGPEGEILGTHKGIIHYTIGQRRGLGLSLKESLYVKKIDTQANEVILCRNEDLFSSELVAENVNWIMYDADKVPERIEAQVKVRYSQTAVEAVVYPIYENDEDIEEKEPVRDATKVRVVFKSPVRAITAGQAAVFYMGDVVIGGGTIVHNSNAEDKNEI